MRGFWKRADRLERELRAQRPEPRTDFLHTLESRVDGKAYRRPARSCGSVSPRPSPSACSWRSPRSAGSATRPPASRHAVKAATHVVAPQHKAVDTGKSVPLSSAQAQYLVAMCFHRHTIYVDSHAARILQRARRDARPLQGRPAHAARDDEGRLHQGQQRPGHGGEREPR